MVEDDSWEDKNMSLKDYASELCKKMEDDSLE